MVFQKGRQLRLAALLFVREPAGHAGTVAFFPGDILLPGGYYLAKLIFWFIMQPGISAFALPCRPAAFRPDDGSRLPNDSPEAFIAVRQGRFHTEALWAANQP